MKKGMIKSCTKMGRKIAAGVGEISQDLAKGSNKLVKNVSAEMSRIDFGGIYKGAEKSFKIKVKTGNKVFKKSVRNFKRSAFMKVLKSDFPKYMTQIAATSAIATIKFHKATERKYVQSRKWAMKRYPKMQKWVGNASYNVQSWLGQQGPNVKRFVVKNYPKVEKAVVNQLPIFRAMVLRGF